jgi:thioredoxin
MKQTIILFFALAIALSVSASKPVTMNKQMFIDKVFDYQSDASEWKYKGDKPAIIDFWAPWCGPCRQLSRTLNQIASEFGDKIYIYKINVDEERELAATFEVRSIPYLLFVPMEGIPHSANGALSRNALRRAVNDVLLKK